ncbi:MAG: hypothetical protein GXP46_05565 [Deferribacteres bacterium]|nr:hypothetical protein [Deferribacteres bacterium]
MYNLEGYIYLFTGVVIFLIYAVRKRGLSGIGPHTIPELDQESFTALKKLLDTAYERTLYLGTAFLFLAYVTLSGWGFETKFLFIAATIGIFLYNVPPRNRVMKLLMFNGVSWKAVKERGIRF